MGADIFDNIENFETVKVRGTHDEKPEAVLFPLSEMFKTIKSWKQTELAAKR